MAVLTSVAKKRLNLRKPEPRIHISDISDICIYIYIRI